jgi:endonuclease/exonuclease/phosphatase family metal-dependent hydrolase
MAAAAGSGAAESGPVPGSVRFATYNMLDLFAGDSAEDRRHYELVAGVIRSLEADVLAVQEILAPDAETAARRLRQLAGDAGLHCEVPGPGGQEAAVAFGGHGYHVGLMWRDGIDPVAGSLRCYGGRDFWHGLALVTLDVGGTPIRHGAFHASPFGRRLRADQNERLVAAVTRPRGEPPVLVGADWNAESADRGPDGTLYEPADPYAGVEWFADLIYQCQWDYDEQGRRRHRADREPGDVLWAGGLHDAAAVTGAAWQPTAGHHPADVYGAHGVRRRIDAIRVTEKLVPALRAHQVIDTAQTRAASDHLPVVVEYVPAAARA